MLAAAISFLAFLVNQAYPASAIVQERQTRPFPSRTLSLDSLKSPSPTSPLLVHCDGSVYGRGLNVASCNDVFQFMPHNDTQVVFAERKSGIQHDIPLPWRTFSSDGKCFTQPVLAEGAISGRASATELGRAAFTLLHHCVTEKGVGGIAANLGGDDRMRIAIASYSPNVRCDRGPTSGPPIESCFHIFNDMPASITRYIFGNRGDPRANVHLPMIFKATDARCMITIGISGQSTSATWYELWAAVKAIFSMCVRENGKGGKATRIGLRRNILIEMSDEYPDVAESSNPSVFFDGFDQSASLSFETDGAGRSSPWMEVVRENDSGLLSSLSDGALSVTAQEDES